MTSTVSAALWYLLYILYAYIRQVRSIVRCNTKAKVINVCKTQGGKGIQNTWICSGYTPYSYNPPPISDKDKTQQTVTTASPEWIPNKTLWRVAGAKFQTTHSLRVVSAFRPMHSNWPAPTARTTQAQHTSKLVHTHHHTPHLAEMVLQCSAVQCSAVPSSTKPPPPDETALH